MESNDSPEIPDRGETSDIPGLLSRWERERGRGRERERELLEFVMADSLSPGFLAHLSLSPDTSVRYLR